MRVSDRRSWREVSHGLRAYWMPQLVECDEVELANTCLFGSVRFQGPEDSRRCSHLGRLLSHCRQFRDQRAPALDEDPSLLTRRDISIRSWPLGDSEGIPKTTP